MASNTFNLQQIEANFKRVLQTAPTILGNDAVNFFQDSFKRQGWLGSTLVPWQKRKGNKDAGRLILVKRARLKRSIRITRIEGLTTHIGTDVPYARAHNEGFRGTVNVPAHQRNKFSSARVGTGRFGKSGKERMKTVQTLSGTINVRAHTKRMNIPKRQFMGNSPYLEKQLNRRLMAELLKGLRNT